MNYDESIEYIHSINWCFCNPGLERIERLCNMLGNPQKQLKFIHVAGTNGKGSFCAMLDSVLRKAGYKVGLFTSPYIRRFNERICFDGKPISDEDLADITSYVRPFADSMKEKPTEFELITAIGFEYFKRVECDIVILEAGMGGRLDSTNIIDAPVLSIITGISLDHTSFLGDTTEKIAYEKAGIIKDFCPVLFGGNDICAEKVIHRVAKEKNADFFVTDHSSILNIKTSLNGSIFDFGDRKNIKISLLGLYQPLNAANVLSAIDILRDNNITIPEDAVYSGLYEAVWHARFEMISKSPIVIYDGAHNPEGITAAVKSVQEYFGDNKVFVLTGVMKDKDYESIASDLSKIASRAFTVTPDNPRALEAKEYAKVLKSHGIIATDFEDLKSALTSALEATQKAQTPLLCLGSLYMYSELMDIFEKITLN